MPNGLKTGTKHGKEELAAFCCSAVGDPPTCYFHVLDDSLLVLPLGRSASALVTIPTFWIAFFLLLGGYWQLLEQTPTSWLHDCGPTSTVYEAHTSE